MVDVGVQRRLVARDLETDKLVAWAVLRVLQQGPAAVEVALVEVDQAAGAQLEGRAAAGRPNGGLRRLEIGAARSEEHTSELQSLMRISYAVFCLKKKNTPYNPTTLSICNQPS